MSGVKVSVIIPVFNVEKYLNQCLDSLVVQTFADFEIICVDDASTDKSPDILAHYANLHDNIHVIRQENAGGGAARNLGFRMTQGDYVLFLDADDFFDPSLIAKCYESAVANQADIVLFGGKRYDSSAEKLLEKREFLRREYLPQTAVFSRDDIPDNILQISNPAPWSKFFSKKFLLETGLQFQELPNSNDFYFSLGTVALASRICVVDEDLVYYRINAKGSTQLGKYREPLCFLEAICALYDLLNSRDIYEQIKQSFLHVALSSVKYNLESVQNDEARMSILGELLKENIERMELLHTDEGYYSKSITWEYACNISSALTQYKETLKRREADQTLECLVPYRGEAVVDVSVLIPVYNAEPFLYDALNSIVQQTLSSIEIICVNDGSTDDSLDVLKKWAINDNRISIYTQKNMGQSAARNKAMQLALGKYVYFMDADDTLEINALQILYNMATSEDLDVLYFDGDSFYDGMIRNQEEYAVLANSYSRHNNYEGKIYDGPSFFVAMQLEKDYFVSPCLQLLKKEFVNEHRINFHAGVIHEDNAFSFAVILNASRASYVRRVLFHRRIHESSTMTSQASFKNSYGYFVAFQDMYDTFLKMKQALKSDVCSAAITRMCITLKNARDAYLNMPREQRGGEMGLAEEYQLFKTLVADSAVYLETNVKLQKAYQDKTERGIRIKNLENEKSERGIKIKELEKEKAERGIKIKELEKEKAERGIKIKELEKEKADRGVKIKTLEKEKAERGIKIKELEKEKADRGITIKKLQEEKKEVESHFLVRLDRKLRRIFHR